MAGESFYRTRILVKSKIRKGIKIGGQNWGTVPRRGNALMERGTVPQKSIDTLLGVMYNKPNLTVIRQ